MLTTLSRAIGVASLRLVSGDGPGGNTPPPDGAMTRDTGRADRRGPDAARTR